MSEIHITGELHIDSNRGVIYFHSEHGITLLRICRLPTPIPMPLNPVDTVAFGMLDITCRDVLVSWREKDR